MNAAIYAKIDWDSFQENFQSIIKNEVTDKRENFPKLKAASDAFGKAIKNAEPKVKTFRPGEVTEQIEALRSYVK